MDDLNLNLMLGPYRLDRIVGRGGMGTVYAATEMSTGEQAAIKVLSPTLADDESFRERFKAEIESLKKLQHPNIVQLYGFGEQDGHLFYVMELVDGRNLQEELRQGRRFNWREVTAISIEICTALKHAHDHGIIHRDLKPANLLLTSDEQIKLVDFGIARLFGVSAMTTGSVMGTADYMAPEQSEGKPVDPRTDLYSLGSVMYALLVGKPPFSGKSIAEVVHKVRFDTPIPVCRIVNEAPIEMEQLIDQLLEKQPDRRVPTALAVSHRLRAMEHALSLPPADADAQLQELETDEMEPASGEVISNRPTIQLPSNKTESVEAVHVTTTEIPNSKAHFTRVDDTEPQTQATIPWSALGSLLFVVTIGFLSFIAIRAWTQPPQADALYQRIMQTKDADDDRWFIAAESDVDQFLDRFPEDPRQNEVSEIKDSIELDRLERRLNLQLRRSRSSPQPLEQLYLDAMRKATSDPAQSVSELQAILDLYTDDSELSPSDEQRLKLVRRQRQTLQRRIDRESTAHLQLLEDRLKAAKSLATSDPEQARAIYLGIVELYGRHSWAAAPVKQAQQALAELAPNSP